MGAGIAGRCSRNRCLGRWTVWDSPRNRRAQQVERTRRKTWSRGPIRGFCGLHPYWSRGGRQLVQDLMGTCRGRRRPGGLHAGSAGWPGSAARPLVPSCSRPATRKAQNSDHAATCPFTNRSSCRCRTVHAAGSSARRPHSILGGRGSQVLKFLDWLALVADRCGISRRFRG
jgi:hypothetical protein